jgi:hypothetical protein
MASNYFLDFFSPQYICAQFAGFDPLDDDSFFVHTNWEAPMWALNRIPLGNANLADPTGWHVEIAEREDAVLDMCKVSNCGTFFLLAYIENVAEVGIFSENL